MPSYAFWMRATASSVPAARDKVEVKAKVKVKTRNSIRER
jgi:hypothetical protein